MNGKILKVSDFSFGSNRALSPEVWKAGSFVPNVLFKPSSTISQFLLEAIVCTLSKMELQEMLSNVGSFKNTFVIKVTKGN